jgi:antitoxin (DNA-binding transcriptional repressor) of toxin-antitoxin stability system
MVEIVIIQDYVGFMKVKMADLKTHLSKHVQSVRRGDGPIEVCLREEVVAYLTPVGEAGVTAHSQGLRDRLAAQGLLLSQLGRLSDRRLTPALPGDGRKTGNTVLEMRAEKDW